MRNFGFDSNQEEGMIQINLNRRVFPFGLLACDLNHVLTLESSHGHLFLKKLNERIHIKWKDFMRCNYNDM